RVVADELAGLLGVDFAAVALVDEESGTAEGLVARRHGADLDWWPGQRVDLRKEPSGIASAVFEGGPVQVYDVGASTLVSRRLADLVGAKSGAWIPMIAEERVIGVLVLATTDAHRSFTQEELDVLQAIASEAALALDRSRSAAALADALGRERLVAEISRKVRSEIDVAALMQVAVEETGRALGASRCLIRLGEAGDLRLAAEWYESGLDPVRDVARLPASNLAARELRTVALADVATASELADESLGGRESLLELGSRAALAVPIVVFDRLIGVVAIHHGAARRWTPVEISLVEAVARELGVALQTARLLGENRRRLDQQASLLHAAQVLTSELDLEGVLERLVLEVAQLLEVDAADCYLYDAGRDVLRCAAVHGFDDDLVGFEFPAHAGLAGRALAERRPVRSSEYAQLGERVPSPAYEGFERALVAPIAWGDEIRGVLGVGTRDASREFGDDDVDVLGTLAGLAALALRNAESFAERSRQARIQQGFFLIAEVLGEPVSRGQTVAAIAQAAAQALGGDSAAVL
ncbi:MAG TPA: GAF domain-containing protein, partial [Gaiellaceae bacterium]